jgi:Ras-related protein Rab-8A
MTTRTFDMQIKLLTLGDSGVGKTCLLLRYVNDTYSPSFMSTIGIDFKTKFINHDEKRIKLQIWDTAGQERFRTITNSYFKGCQGILLVFDVTDRTTFTSVRRWVEQIEANSDPTTTINKILIGNKCDMDGRKVSYEEGEELAKELNITYIETSCKMDINVTKAYTQLVGDIYNRIKDDNNPLSNSIKLTPVPKKTEKSGCC